MTPTPPSPEDNIFDLAGLDPKPAKPKGQTAESDFEKELEALFAADLTEPEVKAPAPGPSAKEDILLLEDFESEPAHTAAPVDDVLDLDDFSVPGSAASQDDDALDLGVFAAGGELDITPPEDASGGKDGGIDTAALDDLISGLGETKEPESLAVPLSQPVEDSAAQAPAAEPQVEPEQIAPAAALPDEESSLPAADLGAVVPEAGAEDLLDSGSLDIAGIMAGGMMEGLAATADEAGAEQSLDPEALLDQIIDGPVTPGVTPAAPAVEVAEPAPVAAPAEAAPISAAAIEELQEKLAALAMQISGGSVAVVRLEDSLSERDRAIIALGQRLQASQDEAQALRRELSDLRGQIEETLRQHAQTEETLRQRAQADEKIAAELKERLALVEDRQLQIDRDVRTEIERAVPREAARVIREEIAALAASMHEE